MLIKQTPLFQFTYFVGSYKTGIANGINTFRNTRVPIFQPSKFTACKKIIIPCCRDIRMARGGFTSYISTNTQPLNSPPSLKFRPLVSFQYFMINNNLTCGYLRQYVFSHTIGAGSSFCLRASCSLKRTRVYMRPVPTI